VLEWFQRRSDLDPALRIQNVERLRKLKQESGAERRIFCAHDPVEFASVSQAG
jgi:ABC-type sugar transport system ATPase subunit